MRAILSGLILFAGCSPCVADITGATTAEIGEPVKLTTTAFEAEWVVIGEGVASTSHGGGRWAIVYASEPGEVTCIAAHVLDGRAVIDTHTVQIGGTDSPAPNKLDQLFADAVAGKVPPDQRPVLEALAQNFRSVAGLINAGQIDGSKASVGTSLGHLNTGTIGGAIAWLEMSQAINSSLDAIESAGGLQTPEDYTAALLSIARVLETEAGR